MREVTIRATCHPRDGRKWEVVGGRPTSEQVEAGAEITFPLPEPLWKFDPETGRSATLGETSGVGWPD